MAKNKVTFIDGTIFLNGKVVGRMSGSSNEVWVTFYRDYDDKTQRDEFVARYKYMKPRTNAKHFVKWALTHFTPVQVLDGIKANTSPMGWAEANGYKRPVNKEFQAYLARLEMKQTLELEHKTAV